MSFNHNVAIHILSIYLYSCCSHLEHRAYLKRFVSLQFLKLRQSVGLHGRLISRLKAATYKQTQNKSRQASMPRVGLETTIPVFKRAKMAPALDGAATMIGCNVYILYI
jgi:hypothetical protein